MIIKVLCFGLIVLAVLPLVMAGVEVAKVDKGSVVIAELNNPAVFDFTINNTGGEENFEIYSLVGVAFSPRGTFSLSSGETKMEIRAFLDESMLREGFFSFGYEIKGQKSGIFKDRLTVKIVPLKEAFEISAEPIHPDDSEVTIMVKNSQNANLEDVEMEFESKFFDSATETFSFSPFEEKSFMLGVNKDKTKRLLAGVYDMTSVIKVQDAETEVESEISYLEKEGTSVRRDSSGFIVRKNVVTKTNEGSVPVAASIGLKKDIISRLFTINSPDPVRVERSGLVVNYEWEKNIGPGEMFVVESTTNYTFPFILIVLVVLVIVFAKTYSRKALNLEKRVSFVRTKGGEFALKVSVRVKARKHVDRVQVIDTLPNMVKLYEKFGRKPDKIDKDMRRLGWNLERLNAGEERVFSYVIYSKLRVVGRFELPAATAIFELDGKTGEVRSNRAYFVSETSVEE